MIKKKPVNKSYTESILKVNIYTTKITLFPTDNILLKSSVKNYYP